MRVIPIVEYRSIPDKKNHARPAIPEKKPIIGALIIAQNEFGAAFNREEMTLYGHAIRLNDLMCEVNRKRLSEGRDQVLYNPAWDAKL